MVKFWRAVWNNPILQLELRRVRRRRWWPGRRFFLLSLLVYPVLLAAMGFCGAVAVLAERTEVQVVAAVVVLAVALVVGVLVWILSLVLPWAAPALTASTVARERELGTLDLVRTTLLSERSIVLGKLGGCLVQLWPGIFLLIILTPFQIIRLFWGSLCLCPSSDLTLLVAAYELGIEAVVIGVVLTILLGTLRPLADLAFHTAVGLFVSVLSHSAGVAIAISYGAVLATRAFVWLIVSVLVPTLVLTLASPLLVAGATEGYEMTFLSGYTWLLVSSLPPLAVILAEFVGSAMLVWGAIRRLARG